MRLRDLLFETWLSLIANKARSLLTILGIVIGIASVIAMTSLIAGVQGMFMSEMGLSQARVVTIYSGMKTFTQEDIENLERFFPEYEAITPLLMGFGTATGSEGTADMGVTGVDEDYLKIEQVKLAAGRSVSTEDIQGNAQVIMMGKGLIEQLFGSEDADVLGKTIRMGPGADSFTIVGILEGDRNSGRYYMQAFMPATTLQARVTGTQEIYQMMALAREEVDVLDLVERTKSFFTELKGDDSVYVYSMQEMINQLNTTLMGFSILLTSIASISLFVGGIGIMNMMLTNVTERTREIGLRKSLGAHTGDIILQFLVEAIGLCLVGGVFGIFFGYLGALGLAAVVNMTQAVSNAQIFPVIGIESIAITVGVCAFIGIVFGLYPARRAAKLDPVDSLRYQ